MNVESVPLHKLGVRKWKQLSDDSGLIVREQFDGVTRVVHESVNSDHVTVRGPIVSVVRIVQLDDWVGLGSCTQTKQEEQNGGGGDDGEIKTGGRSASVFHDYQARAWRR